MYRHSISFLHRTNPSITPPPETQKWRLIMVICIAFSAILVIVGISLAHNSNSTDKVLQPKKVGFFGSMKNFLLHPDDILEGQKEDRINILLLGIGGNGHDGAYLSDTNIIASLKPSTGEVALISIPRDLNVKIDGYGYRKINNADAIGEAKTPGQGGDYAREIFSKTFDISIPYYIRVDFTAFAEIIDEVGGVDINVERSFNDYQYPNGEKTLGPICVGETESSPCRYLKADFTAGLQHMDGRTALIYSRSRHGNNGEGSDFARSHRQQQVLTALKEKVLSAGVYTNPLTLQKIISSLTSHINTNLQIDQLLYLGNFSRTMSKDIRNLTLDDAPKGFLASSIGANGAYLLGPRAGNFTDINTAIDDIFTSTSTSFNANITTATTLQEPASSPTTTSNKPASTETEQPTTPDSSYTIQILNGTWQTGLAKKMATQVEKAGLKITSTGNSPTRPVATTSIFTTTNIDIPTLQKLNTVISATPSKTIPDWLSATSSTSPLANIIIILGEDIHL